MKDQILRFNELLERQVELMSQVCQTGVASMSLSNGSQMHSSKSLSLITMNLVVAVVFYSRARMFVILH